MLTRYLSAGRRHGYVISRIVTALPSVSRRSDIQHSIGQMTTAISACGRPNESLLLGTTNSCTSTATATTTTTATTTITTVLAVPDTSSCVGPQNKTGHPAHRYRQLMQVPVLSACGI